MRACVRACVQVIKSKRPFTMQAKVEVNILELLRERDPEGKYNCGENSAGQIWMSLPALREVGEVTCVRCRLLPYRT